jgi:hypothetical protein
LDELYKNDQTDKILIEIKKQVISKLSLLQAFKSVSVLINHKATQSCLDDMFFSLKNPSKNYLQKFLGVFYFLYRIINYSSKIS